MNIAAAATCVIAVAIWFWVAMLFVHEIGHVGAAWLTGGWIVSLEIRPGVLSHTLVQPNPRPSLVVWGGVLSGWFTPLLCAPAWREERFLAGRVLRAWAAFCWLAGGCYLAVGAGERLTDSGQLVLLGWPTPLLVLLGAAVASLGYLWSRSAWIEISALLDREQRPWWTAGFWWLVLLVWAGAQQGIAILLSPTG